MARSFFFQAESALHTFAIQLTSLRLTIHIVLIMRHYRVHPVSSVTALKSVRASIIWAAILPQGSTGAARPG
jgi:hypothetical protein